MTNRKIKNLFKSYALTEGAGVTVHRSIGTPACRNLDPFVMLDHFGSDHPDDYIAGFPDHPHRGFITFTYMLDGTMRHHDSMGNEGNLESGGAQWMKAGSGVIHSEMPQQENGLMRGFQLWINLPTKLKMSAPNYTDLQAEEIPIHNDNGALVKVLIGKYKNIVGAVTDNVTNTSYLDISLQADSNLIIETPISHTAFIYVFEGSIQVEDKLLSTHSFASLSEGERLVLQTSNTTGRAIVVTAKPIGEPIVQHGPFVMNTQEEIEQAMRDYRDGNLVAQ